MTQPLNIDTREAQRILTNVRRHGGAVDVESPETYYQQLVESLAENRVTKAARQELERTTDLSQESIEALSSAFAERLSNELASHRESFESASSSGRRDEIVAAVLGSVASMLLEKGLANADVAVSVTIEIVEVAISAL